MDAFTPRRMLLAGHDAERIAADLARALPELETRTVRHGPLTEEDAAWADSYVGFTVPPGLERSGIRWMHLPMAGVDRVVADLAGTDVVLTRTVGAMPRRIGSYVLAHLLADAWHLREYAAQQLAAQWEPLEPARIAGRTVAVLGTGEIGSGVGQALRAGGYRAVGVNTRGTAAPAFDDVVAHAVVDGLAARGVTVPGDVRLVGCDDALPIETHPRLSTVRLPSAQGVRRAVELLLATDRTPLPESRELFDGTLCLRETT